MNRYNTRRFAGRRRRAYSTRPRFTRNSVGRCRTAHSNLDVRPNQGLITLGEAAPALKELRAVMRVRELYSGDLPGSYLRFLYGLPDEMPVVSRVDQLANEYRINGSS